MASSIRLLILFIRRRRQVEPPIDQVKLGLQMLFTAVTWMTYRYLYYGRPLSFLDFMGTVAIGAFAASGLFWLMQRPSLKQLFADISFWPAVAVSTFVAMCFLVLYGLYYRIIKGRPVEG